MSHEDSPAQYADPELTPARDARDSTNFLVAQVSSSHAGTCIQVLNLYYACFFRAKDVLEL